MASGVYGLRLLAQPRVQRAALAIAAVVVLLYRLAQFVYWVGRIQWGYDFSAYWAAANRLIAGSSPYQPAQLAATYSPQQQFLYLYPPPLAAAVTPLAGLAPSDYHVANWAWFAVGAVVLTGTVYAISRSERLSERFDLLAGRRGWLWLLVGALAFPPVVAELVLGNVHLLLLGLLGLAWLGVRRGGTRGDALAGIGIGLATIIKVFPGLLIVWLLVTRRFRAAGLAVLAAAVVALATLPITGVQPWLDYPRVLANLGSPVDTADTLAPTVWLAPLLGFDVARLLVDAAGLALVVLLGLASRGRAGATTAASFGAAVATSILVAPALYQHYLAILVLAFLLGLSAGVRLRWLALAYLLMWGGQQPALGDLAWVVNRALPTAGALVLLGSLVRVALGRAQPAVPAFGGNGTAPGTPSSWPIVTNR